MSRYMMIFLGLALGLAAPALPCHAAALSKEAVAALVDKMPDADKDGKYTGPAPADAQKVYDELLAGGRDAVIALVDLVAERGHGPDYKARYVLHGLVTYVARPEAENDRQSVCSALVSTLGGSAPKAVQGLVLQEIQCIARKDVAEAIGRFATDVDLYDPAIRALQAIGDTGDVLRRALPQASGRNRAAILQALGALRDARAVPALQAASADADADVRMAARDALGDIGDARAAATLLAAADAASGHERIKATEAVLLLATRLIGADGKKDAERIYRKLWETRTDPAERHVRGAALLGLAEVAGDINDLLAAMKVDDPEIRTIAIRAAAALPGQDTTLRCVDAMKKAAGVERANLLALLGGRGDAAALPAVLGMFIDADELVRIAAMQAAAAIGGPGAAEAILAVATARESKDRAAAAAALAKMRGPETGAAIAAALASAAEPEARAALLSALAERRINDQPKAVVAAVADPDARVRIAALKALAALAGDGELPPVVRLLKETQAPAELAAAEGALKAACSRHMSDRCADLVVPALEGAAPANAAAMLRVLGAAGSRKAMDTVVARTRDPSADVKDAAVRALADWRAKEAAAPLMEIARNSNNPTHKVLALKGAVRLASKSMAADEKMKILPDAARIATRPEDKREVLAALATVQTVEALQIAAACLDDEPVREEAAMAVIQIAEPLSKKNPEAVREPVSKALSVSKNDRVRSTAERILAQTKKP